MSCPPKFKDLHKKTDDVFSKDFHVDCFNNKLTHKYSMGEHGTGTFTHKLDYNTNAGSSAMEVEVKHLMGSTLKFMEGMTVSKTFNSGSETCKVKFEKNCKSSGAKVTFEGNSAIGIAMPPSCVMSKPSLTFDLGKDKITSQLNIKPKDCFNGIESLAFNAVIAAGPAHLGVSAGYGNKGAISHAVKFSKSQNGLALALGVANANTIDLVMSKNLNKSANFGFGSCTFTNLHSKSDYNLKDGNWNSHLAMGYEGCNVGSMTFGKGKMKVDLKTLEYAERGTMKVTDNLDLSFGARSTLNSGFFSGLRMGWALGFSA